LHRHNSAGNASSSCGGAATADSDVGCGYSSEDEEEIEATRLRRGHDGLKRRMLSLNARDNGQTERGCGSRRWSTPGAEGQSGDSPDVCGSPWRARNGFTGFSRETWDGGVVEPRSLGRLLAAGAMSNGGMPGMGGCRDGLSQRRQQQGQQSVCRGQQSPSLVELKEPLEEHVVLLDHEHLGQVNACTVEEDASMYEVAFTSLRGAGDLACCRFSTAAYLQVGVFETPKIYCDLHQ
jgi:hypothetical protein